MSGPGRNEKKGKNCQNTMIMREMLLCVSNRQTSSTYSHEELMELIEKHFPQYAADSNGGK